jgi:hypothetical protein
MIRLLPIASFRNKSIADAGAQKIGKAEKDSCGFGAAMWTMNILGTILSVISADGDGALFEKVTTFMTMRDSTYLEQRYLLRSQTVTALMSFSSISYHSSQARAAALTSSKQKQWSVTYMPKLKHGKFLPRVRAVIWEKAQELYQHEQVKPCAQTLKA